MHGLLLRCADHDERALADVYRLTSPYLNAMVNRRLNTPRDVEATLVTTYVTIWRQAASYAGSSGTSAWAWILMIVEQALAPLSINDRSRSWVPGA